MKSLCSRLAGVEVASERAGGGSDTKSRQKKRHVEPFMASTGSLFYFFVCLVSAYWCLIVPRSCNLGP